MKTLKSEKKLRDYYGILWDMTTPYMRQVWDVSEKTREEYIQRNIQRYYKRLNYEKNTERCLRALVGINEWDACPFCGRNQRDYLINLKPHDDDCPVKIAEELVGE